jgi:hypothetical protein
MFGKLAFFALGFALGTRTGREGVREMVSFVRWASAREEVQTAFGLARSAAALALERGQEYASKRAA